MLSGIRNTAGAETGGREGAWAFCHKFGGNTKSRGRLIAGGAAPARAESEISVEDEGAAALHSDGLTCIGYFAVLPLRRRFGYLGGDNAPVGGVRKSIGD
jgi:hypothetical protein